MTQHRIDRGGYYLLPYAGPRRDRIVRAIRPAVGSHWEVQHFLGARSYRSYALLEGCARVTPSEAEKMLKKRRK